MDKKYAVTFIFGDLSLAQARDLQEKLLDQVVDMGLGTENLIISVLNQKPEDEIKKEDCCGK